MTDRHKEGQGVGEGRNRLAMVLEAAVHHWAQSETMFYKWYSHISLPSIVILILVPQFWVLFVTEKQLLNSKQKYPKSPNFPQRT